jgi:hypothetical protein
MKMPTQILFLVLTVSLFAACKSSNKVEGVFTEEELSWLAYKDGEHLLYQNHDSTGDEVTLFVSAKDNPTQLRTYYPIEAEVVAGNPEHGDYFKIYLLKDERDFKRYLKFGDVYRSFDPIEPQAEFKVGDVVYKDVYLFKEDTANGKANRITEVYFVQGFGVVQYHTHDGRVFQLMNNELTQR